MSVLLVTYDLQKSDRGYEAAWKYLKQFIHCQGLGSAWLIDTTMSCAEVRNALVDLVDQNDRVFVGRMRYNTWAGSNVPCADWLNSVSRKWCAAP